MSEIKRGDIVKILSTGKFGIISDYQQVHNRYQLREVSGWQYDINNVEKISDDLISVLNAPSDQGEAARLREAMERILFILNQDTADVSDMGICIAIASEALSSHTEDTGIQKMREALQAIWENSDDQGARYCAADALGITIPGIKDGREGT